MRFIVIALSLSIVSVACANEDRTGEASPPWPLIPSNRLSRRVSKSWKFPSGLNSNRVWGPIR